MEENKCTLVVGLLQKSRRKQRALGEQNLSIGFAIYQVRVVSLSVCQSVILSVRLCAC